MTNLSSVPMGLSAQLRPLLASITPGLGPLVAVQSGEHPRSLLANEIRLACAIHDTAGCPVTIKFAHFVNEDGPFPVFVTMVGLFTGFLSRFS